MIISKHRLSYCKLCEIPIVICATCGVNQCSGTTGTLGGTNPYNGDTPCPDCDEAWNHQKWYYANPKDIYFANVDKASIWERIRRLFVEVRRWIRGY